MNELQLQRKAALIYEKWQASLTQKQRNYNNVQTNFDELWDDMQRAKVTFDIAHEFLDKAIKAHLPSQSVAKHTYARMKRGISIDPFDDWFKHWKDEIASMCKLSFYAFFPIEGQEEEKQYGQMSAREYQAQRKIADAFQEVTPEELAAIKARTSGGV